MALPLPLAPGFVAVSWDPSRTEIPIDPRTSVLELSTDFGEARRPGLAVTSWGLGPYRLADERYDELWVLGKLARGEHGGLSSADVAAMLSAPGSDRILGALPPFAAVGILANEIRVVRDYFGFRQIYVTEGSGWAAISTSARVLAAVTGAGLDEAGLAVQSLLGWQLADRTLFSGIRTITSTCVTARDGRLIEHPDPEWGQLAGTGQAAVEYCASVLRASLSDLLDDYPDMTLQLTGGQDSRLLLSAIPQSRRRDVRVMTLGRRGDPDVEIAAQLAGSHGLEHAVSWFDGLADLSPIEAFDLCIRAADRIDCAADPLALAGLSWAESQVDQGPRLSGLGGEVARGFYYLGSARSVPVTRQRSDRLTAWRMFANEAVEPGALRGDFLEQSLAFARDEVYRCLSRSASDWLTATDGLYLHHRMRRWAGVTDTAVCFDRVVVNPMLDRRFIATVDGLPPAEKYNSRFLGRLQVALDPALAAIPLDGRPAPTAYANPGPSQRARTGIALAHRLGRKTMQRIRRAQRPPSGATILAGRVTEHLREHPEVLHGAHRSGAFSEAWIEDMLAGHVDPSPSTLALIVNLAAATGPPTAERGTVQ